VTRPARSPDGQRPAKTVWAFTIALALFVASRCLVPMDETDLFYNLRLGEIVLATHSVPRVNLLSFTAPDYPDPNLAWLFQVLLALAYRAGGIPGTVMLKTVFVVLTFQLLYRVAIRRGAHPALAGAALALAAWAAEPRFVERPHLVTFLGIALVLLALERTEAGRPWLLRAMIPLGLIWANGNSCFFLAPALLLLYALGATGDGPEPWLRRARREAALVALGLIPLLFATPSGAGFMGYVANHFRMPSLRPLQEYRVAEWPTDGPFLFLLVAVTLATVLSVKRATKPSIDTDRIGFARHLLAILALAVLGSRRIRFVAEFALLAGPFVAARGTEVLARICAAQGTRTRRAGSWVALAGLALLTIGPRARGALLARSATFAAIDLDVEEGLVPRAAIDWLNAHDLRDRLYNDLEVGSYLVWEGWPRHRVFQDPRINGYPPELHAILRRQDLGRAEWEALLDRFDVQAALVTFPNLNPRAALFDPELWALCYRTAEALVFVRRDSAHASRIEADEIPVTFRFDSATGVEPVPIARPVAQSPLAACEWNRRLGDFFIARGDFDHAGGCYRRALADGVDCLPLAVRNDARELAATLALRSAEPARAARLLTGLSSIGALTNLGFALIQLGRAPDALDQFEAVLARMPDSPEASFGRGLALARLNRNIDASTALRKFLARWPGHLAAPRARQLVDLIGTTPDVSRAPQDSPL
jgi:tetratricopeptide (TPR) repeat protein